MGKRGPQPNPTKLRLLNGETGKRINALEPEPEVGVPPMPPEATEMAQQIYEETGARLLALGLITLVDEPTLYQYATWFAQFRVITRMINETSLLVRSEKTGAPMRNPLLMAQRHAAEKVRQFAADLGLSPAARVSLRVSNGSTADERERLLS